MQIRRPTFAADRWERNQRKQAYQRNKDGWDANPMECFVHFILVTHPIGVQPFMDCIHGGQDATNPFYLRAMQWEIWQLWTAAGMALLILEVFVPGFVLACLGIGAFGGAISAYFEIPFAAQLGVSSGIALLAFLFLRPVMLRMGFTGDEAATGIEALIGKDARITQAFDSESGLGRCQIDGDDWRAKLEPKHATSTSSIVRIIRVESNTLIVQHIN